MPRLPLPVLYYSLKAAAKELDIEEEYLIQWLKEGKIRACVAFDSFETHAVGLGFVSDACDLKKANDEFQEQCLEVEDNDHFLNYINEPDYDQCVLNKIFATEHSKMIVKSCHYSPSKDENDVQTVTLEAALRGLWQINTIEDTIKLLSSTQEEAHYIYLVPYIKEAFYSSKQMQDNSGIVSGFDTELKTDDIKISKDDMERLSNFLYQKGSLFCLAGKGKRLEHKALKKLRSPTIELQQAFVQMVINFLGEDIISEPYLAKKLINEKLARLGGIEIDLKKNAIANAIKNTREPIKEAKKIKK